MACSREMRADSFSSCLFLIQINYGVHECVCLQSKQILLASIRKHQNQIERDSARDHVYSFRMERITSGSNRFLDHPKVYK